METSAIASDSALQPAPPASKKAQSAEWKAARERLARGTSIKPEFEYELLAMFARNELGAAVTMPALFVIFSLASMFWAPVLEAVIWLGLVVSAKLALFWLCGRFLAQPSDEVDIRQWRRRFIACDLLNGVTWAGFVLVGSFEHAPAPVAAFSSHVFIFASLIVVLAIRMTFASSILPIVYAGTIPMTLAIVVRLVMLGNPFYLAIAAMAAGVHMYFIFLARGLNSTVLAMLEFRAEKDALIAELEQAKSISDEARLRAEEANIAKSRFLATMSHELRTPLNAILGFSEIMRAEILGRTTTRLTTNTPHNIHESGQHLLNLINEILDISRIEAGRYELHEGPIRLAEIVEDCHRLMRLRAEDKGLQIVEDFERDLAASLGRRARHSPDLPQPAVECHQVHPTGGTITLTSRSRTHDGGQLLSA